MSKCKKLTVKQFKLLYVRPVISYKVRNVKM